MSITKPILLDETGKELLAEMKNQNKLMGAMLREKLFLEQNPSMKDIINIIRNGMAETVFSIGDQIIVTWKDVTSNTEYEAPLDIVAFGTVELPTGETMPKMTTQWHYATPFGVQFTNYQAFYHTEEGLAAGTYHIEIGTTWGTHCVSGKSYQFTLTKAIPAGGQLAGFRGAPDQAPANWKVYSYESNVATEALETVAVTEGTGGTKLGVLKTGGDGTLNCLQATAYGYNRWAKSALRQWLNSDKGVGEWWTPQHKFDRCPDQLSTKAGFLTGFDEEFRSILRATKVVTALNTVNDKAESDVEALETTYDKVYIPALEQMYINPQLKGEGTSWEYWKRASGTTTKMQHYRTYPQIRTFAIENHNSAQNVRLRSASRGYSYFTWGVYSSGYVYYYYAIHASRCAPACDLC